MRIRLIIALLALAFPALSHADETVSLKAGFMSLNPSGQIAAGGGSRVDLDSTLNFKRSNSFTGEIALQFGDHRLSAEYLPLKFDGSGTLASPVTFNGTTYTGTVTSQLKADVVNLAYTYYLVNMDDMPSRLQLGIEAAVKITQAQMSMSMAGTTSSRSVTLPIPTIGARGRVALADFLGLTGHVGYLGYAGNRFLDADAQVEFSPVPMAGLYGGYRYISLKVDSKGVFADTRFAGPYIGDFIRF